MIQFREAIADAYVRPARNVAMPSMPGRQVKFLQGHAVIKDGRDLVAMLRRADVLVVLTSYALSWWDEFTRHAGQIKAEVRWPAEGPPKKVTPREDRTWPHDPVTGRYLKKKPVETG